MTQCEDMAAFFKALGHPTRMRIVKELLDGRRCVGDIEVCLDLTQTNTSQHLHVLRSNGIVDCLKEGNTRCYHLSDPERIRSILSMVEDRKEM
ncbi:MAG: metalloregulator ArsR/SmtB family transcription factor [Thermodesulfobacteriota bacterium]|nr:metalloregulator ArsR/SmtB family transcription factor [Thermodesulfobacteriota bacterium]